MKIDFHVHSKYSRRPSSWILQKLGCPESFAEPEKIYQVAKQRGMTAVTISDHNCIEGAVKIAHLPDTFVSEEITTYFPEDQCKVHVLAIDITENQHREFQRIRQNIFDLVAYLNHEGIIHAVAHPLYAVNDRLTLEHFEKLVLLFRTFELNGTRSSVENQCLKRLIQGLTRADIEALEEKHRLTPPFSDPWEKKLIAGSDDHSSLYLGTTYTEIEGTDSLKALSGLKEKVDLNLHVNLESPLAFAHTIYGTAWQFYRNKFNLERYADKDMLMRFLDRSLTPNQAGQPSLLARISTLWSRKRRKPANSPAFQSLMDLLQFETRKLIQDHPELLPEFEDDRLNAFHQEQRWFRFVDQSSNRLLLHFCDHLMDHLSGGNVFSIFHTIGSSGGLFSLMAPYYFAYSHFAKGQAFSREVAARFDVKHGRPPRQQVARVAHFTDTFYEVNGVARTLQQSVDCAARYRKDLTIVTCDRDERQPQNGVRCFKPVDVYELPEYPEQNIFLPPFLEILDFCYNEGFNHIHTSTPGPLGLAALAVAKILKLPISGTYHTAFPQYARILTGDDSIADLIWRYTLWYYGQMDWIYAPSGDTRRELVGKGLEKDKIRVYPRGIDIGQFHPSKRNGCFARYSIRDSLKLLYVGRVSREKSLPLLMDAFKSLLGRLEKISLVVVGDGPYMTEMKKEAQGLPVLFTGYLEGEELADIYASSDLFVFPSATDTFGNVVLEAQASGLPVVVTDKGGPVENVRPGETAVVVHAEDQNSLISALESLLRDPSRMREMGISARRYMEDRSFDAAFLKTWRLYEKFGIRADELLA